MKVSSFLSCEMSHKTVRVIINGVLKTKLAGHVFQYLTSMLLLLVCVNVLRLNISASLSPSCSRQSRKKSKGPCGLWFRYQPLKQVRKKNKKTKKKKSWKWAYIRLPYVLIHSEGNWKQTNEQKNTPFLKHTFEEVHVVQVPQGTANPFFEKCLCCVSFCSLCSMLVIHT